MEIYIFFMDQYCKQIKNKVRISLTFLEVSSPGLFNGASETTNTRMTQQLDLDMMDVFDEFRSQLLDIEKANQPGIFGFISFQFTIRICEGTKSRGALVVNPRSPKYSNPFSNTYCKLPL
jgi:hypothetical protein